MSVLSVSVDLSVHTCQCGTVYAIPHWVVSYRCPTCAQRKHEALQAEIDRWIEVSQEQDRKLSALRGALTKARKGAEKP